MQCASAPRGAGGSRDSGGPDTQQTSLEWFERLASIGTAEESSNEIVLHLRDGGMRFVPCVAGQRERRAVYEMIEAALRGLQAVE